MKHASSVLASSALVLGSIISVHCTGDNVDPPADAQTPPVSIQPSAPWMELDAARPAVPSTVSAYGANSLDAAIATDAPHALSSDASTPPPPDALQGLPATPIPAATPLDASVASPASDSGSANRANASSAPDRLCDFRWIDGLECARERDICEALSGSGTPLTCACRVKQGAGLVWMCAAASDGGTGSAEAGTAAGTAAGSEAGVPPGMGPPPGTDTGTGKVGSSSPTLGTGQAWNLIAVHSGKYWDINLARTNPGAWLIQYRPTHAANQEFRFSCLVLQAENNRTSCTIRPNHTNGMCLDIEGSSMRPGAAIIQTPCQANSPSQDWTELNNDTNTDWNVSFRSAHSGLCITVDGASNADEARIVQLPCTDDRNQRFKPASPTR